MSQDGEAPPVRTLTVDDWSDVADAMPASLDALEQRITAAIEAGPDAGEIALDLGDDEAAAVDVIEARLSDPTI